MINLASPVLADSTKPVKKDVNDIYPGNPVKLNTDGELERAKGAVKVYGISWTPHNQYESMAYGSYGAFGSFRLLVIKSGIAQLYPDTYDKGEGESVTIDLWDTSVETAVPQTELYVDDNGLITTNNANSVSKWGEVNLSPSVNGGILEVTVKCG